MRVKNGFLGGKFIGKFSKLKGEQVKLVYDSFNNSFLSFLSLICLYIMFLNFILYNTKKGYWVF